MRASTLLRSNIILLQQVINHTHCPIKTIAAIEFYLDSCGCEVSYFAPVIMNRMEAMHIRHVHMHDSIVEDAIDAIRMLTPGVMRVDILHTSVFYHALLLAAIAFCKADRVITALSQHQVLWVGDQVKLLLPRVTRMGSRDGVTSSQYRSVFVPPQARLWNWTSSEADSVYVKKRHSPHP